MKEQFYEFYKLPEEKVDEIWEKGLLVVDTNVLLDLYRLGPKSREDLKKSIEFFGERIWLPYQAGLEYHRNRESVIKELGGNKYDEFKKLLTDTVIPKLRQFFETYQRHPCIDYKFIEKKIEGFQRDLEIKTVSWKKAYPFEVENDKVLDWITEKFDNKVGDDYSTKELLDIYREGEIRYKANVPPGYKDANNKDKIEAGKRYVYGDLIIWKSVIKKGKEDKVDIIFLTNDNKEDWFEKSKGKTKGPRFELYREFHKNTEQDIIIMTVASFLKEMKERKSVDVKDSSIEDAERALKTEATLNMLKYLTPEWPLLNSEVVLSKSNTKDLNVFAEFEPVTFPKITGLTDETSCFIDSETGMIKSDYLPDDSNNSLGSRKQEDTQVE